jgi:hypothetical protein
MAYTYALIDQPGVLRSDGAIIPLDASNMDYQGFLQWVAAGNTPTPPPVPPPPVNISAGDFLNFFTPTEQQAVQTACLASPTLMLGLTMGLAQGTINLTSPVLAQWMAGLVTAGAITQARSTAILTPA